MSGGEFAETVRSALDARNMSIRSAARALVYDHAYLSRVLNGKQLPSPQLAQALDELLSTEGTLVDLAAGLTADGRERISHAMANPTRVDGRAVEALGDVLAAQRRLDDVLGPAPLLAPAESQMRSVLGLLKDARGPHRGALAEVAAESVQFAGWLNASARNDGRALQFLTQAVDLADEAESGPLAAQVLNFHGYLARQQRRPRAVVRWFSAAYHTPGAHPAQRMGDAAQAAQGYAELGHRDDAQRLLDDALKLEDAAKDQPPRTAYWLTGNFQKLNIGLALLSLQRYADAAASISAGLQGLPADQQNAEWTVEYRDALGRAETHR